MGGRRFSTATTVEPERAAATSSGRSDRYGRGRLAGLRADDLLRLQVDAECAVDGENDRDQSVPSAGTRRPAKPSRPISTNASAKLGSEAPVWYAGAGRRPIQSDQKPRSAGWYSHS